MSDEFPKFHKLQIAANEDIPISAVVRDEDGNKRKYKFSFVDMDDVGEVSTLEPDQYNLSFIDNNHRLHAEAAKGIIRHTKYDVELREEAQQYL